MRSGKHGQGPDGMDATITAIDLIALRIPFHIWGPPPVSRGITRTHIESHYVRVETAGGIVGWGESFGTARPMVVAAFDHYLKPRVIGQRATDETLVARLERLQLSLTRGGPMVCALSGLDIALWDIRGKIAGMPVCDLLGGARRSVIECYASLMQYGGDRELLSRNTTRALEHGYRQIKLHEKTADAVRVSREAIGQDVPLMVDTNCAWTAAEAEAPVAAMAPYNPYWVEEPIYPPEDFEALAQLRKATGVPLAMGENINSFHEFRRMVTMGATDYVQPSIVKMGGISAMSRIAAEVERLGATCVPNAFYVGPGFLAVLHCLAAKEKTSPLERMFAELEMAPFAKTVPVVNGKVEVPRRPGLGADPDDKLLARYKV